MDVSQYLEIFIDESNEHLQSLSDQLMILEKEPDNADTINEIFRAAHSLKGMAGTMGYKRMQNLTHDMENAFSEVRNGNMKVNSALVDTLFLCLDALQEYVSNIQQTQDEGTNDNEHITKALNEFTSGKAATAEPESTVESGATSDATPAADDIALAEFEKNAINEAIKKGMHVYKMRVMVDENCILKAARAFLVFKNLEGHGDIIKSEPSVQDIEDEKFEYEFTIVMVSEESLDKIKGLVKSVSEIKDCVGEEIKEPFVITDDSDNEPEAEEVENKKEEAPSETVVKQEET
ncbi:MAG: Hpt domain-containing protein, partial [Lachnospira sp.]|nr:Hpt domain-containing protein [Lachnospira sp.]